MNAREVVSPAVEAHDESQTFPREILRRAAELEIRRLAQAVYDRIEWDWAVVRPNLHVLLDGEWRFELDPQDRGMAESWHVRHDYPHTAHWPHLCPSRPSRSISANEKASRIRPKG